MNTINNINIEMDLQLKTTNSRNRNNNVLASTSPSEDFGSDIVY